MYFITIAITAGTSNVLGMSDDLKGVIFSTIVTGIITVLGFVITYLSMKRNFKNELQKQNNEIIVNKLSQLYSDIFKFLKEVSRGIKIIDDLKVSDNIEERNNFRIHYQEVFQEFNNGMLHDLLFYSTEDIINVLYVIQRTFDDKENDVMTQILTIISGMLIILAMLRYELTGTIVNPEKYFYLFIDEGRDHVEIYKKCSNAIVQELKLNKKYMIN